jgi:hypothetical protein
LAPHTHAARGDPLEPAAHHVAILASSTIAIFSTVGGAVRLLPWLLDPAVPAAAAIPFARALISSALEASLLVGWPVGWALACLGAVERGEAVVVQSLGRSPWSTVTRFGRSAVMLAATLSACSFLCGADATAPGRVATDLIAEAGLACERWTTTGASGRVYAIPFTDLAWLCAPDRAPAIAGPVPGAVASGAFVVARRARVGGDFRALELEEAHLILGRQPQVAVRVSHVTVHGMTPWSHASNWPPVWRAAGLALTAWASASLAGYAALRFLVRSRGGAIALGALGPLVALWTLRNLERSDAHAVAYATVPIAACLAEGAAVLAADALRRCWPTARSKSSVWGRRGLFRRGRRDG